MADFNQLRMVGEVMSLDGLHRSFEQYWKDAVDRLADGWNRMHPDMPMKVIRPYFAWEKLFVEIPTESK